MQWEAQYAGSLITRAVGCEEGFALLSRYGLQTWTSGGCAVLAAALVEVLGAQPWTIVRLGRALAEQRTEHVVAKLKGAYLDADGAYTGHGMLAKLEASDGVQGRLVHGLILARSDIVCPPAAVMETAALLDRAGVAPW